MPVNLLCNFLFRRALRQSSRYVIALQLIVLRQTNQSSQAQTFITTQCSVSSNLHVTEWRFFRNRTQRQVHAFHHNLTNFLVHEKQKC